MVTDPPGFAMKHLLALLALSGLVACSSPASHSPAGPTPVDSLATPETRALLANLHRTAAERRILFGHQDPTAYGVGWRPSPGEPVDSFETKADVYRVYGDFAAVYGWGVDDPAFVARNIDDIDWDVMRELVIRGYRRGGIHVFSWHGANPKTGTNAWDTTRVVADLLPGGALHDTLKARLDGIAGYLDSLQDGPTKIPVIFRPYHEHNGSWFWWGARFSTPEEYKALWRFTVEYLRDAKGLHHVLYAYSPDRFGGEADYLERYPGDEYIDILGLDDYWDFYGPGRTPAMFTAQMAIVARLALERNKVAALTESGLERIPNPTWFTGVLLDALKADSMASRIAFAMMWRNDRPEHHYVPYPGHAAEADFRAFLDDPMILTERELPPMYVMPTR